MRGLRPALLAALVLAGCGRAPRIVEVDEDENLPAVSLLQAADRRGAGQFLSGFYPPEANSYRWTKGQFSIILQPPVPGAAATLALRFFMPPRVIAPCKRVTLSAGIEGLALPPETYTAEGDFTYTREVPAAVLSDGAVKVDFALDCYLAAGALETRELGVTVMSAALRPR